MNKTYLGDSVYIETDRDRNGFVITTENGYGPSNTIFLEHPEVVENLIKYIDKAVRETPGS